MRARHHAIPQDNFGVRLFESSIRHRSDPIVSRLIHQDPDLGVWDVNPGRLTKAEVAAIRKLMVADPNVKKH